MGQAGDKHAAMKNARSPAKPVKWMYPIGYNILPGKVLGNKSCGIGLGLNKKIWNYVLKIHGERKTNSGKESEEPSLNPLRILFPAFAEMR